MKTFIGLRCNRDYVKKSGKSALHLLIGIDKKFTKVPLDIDWPPHLVDESNNQLLGAVEKDKDANDFNLVIRQEMARANAIFVEVRLQEREISMADFLDMFNNHMRLKDFTVYMADKIKERSRRRKIADSTRKSHENALRWLKKFRKSIAFKDLNVKFIESFEEWMGKQHSVRSKEKRRLDSNTIANVLKYTKAYINLAIKDKIPVLNPFREADVRVHQDVKQIEHMRPSEVASLVTYYNSGEIPIGEKLSLCRLLIACHLSLRISDILKINSRKLADYKEVGKLIFHPQKQVLTKRLKTVYVHIDARAMSLLEDCVALQIEAESKGLKISEPYGRKAIRKIGIKLGINVSGFHIGRHTFATTYIRAGGKVTNLQQIMGHSNINTTMRYVHIVEEDTEGDMVSLSNFYANAKKKSSD